jgi:D-alanyl-D-alanine carboxypeptidase
MPTLRSTAKRVDQTGVDPSVAGAAGGDALVTTVEDLARFLDALLKGQLFRHRATLRQMLAFAPATTAQAAITAIMVNTASP